MLWQRSLRCVFRVDKVAVSIGRTSPTVAGMIGRPLVTVRSYKDYPNYPYWSPLVRLAVSR